MSRAGDKIPEILVRAGARRSASRGIRASSILGPRTFFISTQNSSIRPRTSHAHFAMQAHLAVLLHTLYRPNPIVPRSSGDFSRAVKIATVKIAETPSAFYRLPKAPGKFGSCNLANCQRAR